MRKTFFYKKENTSFFFKHWAKHVRKMPNFLAAFFKLHITWPQTLFGKFSWGSSSYLIYFGLLAKTIRSVCQNCFLWALRIVLREKGFFSKNFFSMFFGIGSNISCTFGKTILVAWPNWRWKSPGEHFENNGFFWKKNILFQTLREKRSEKGKIFRLRSLNCIIRDQKIILRNFFLRFRDLFCHFRTFSKNNSERLSKLLSMSPRDRFGKKIFFGHPDFFPRLLDLQPTILGFCVKKSRVVCQNYILRFQRSVILKKNNFWKNR